jgi:VIT1/CCC1 family predicted Fe2+/Mn2+ transporter
MTEALADDGKISGRGSPVTRGIVTGLMTMAGGLGHALPYLIPNFNVATTIAFIIVFVELWIIAWIRSKYMDTPFLRAVFEVVVGGAIVFAVGILIGSS